MENCSDLMLTHENKSQLTTILYLTQLSAGISYRSYSKTISTAYTQSISHYDGLMLKTSMEV